MSHTADFLNRSTFLSRKLSVPQYQGDQDFEVAGWKFPDAIAEQFRPPRIVRVGLIQHSIVLPTTEPLKTQRDAIYTKIKKYIEHAAKSEVKVVCLQEAWSTYFPRIG